MEECIIVEVVALENCLHLFLSKKGPEGPNTQGCCVTLQNSIKFFKVQLLKNSLCSLTLEVGCQTKIHSQLHKVK